MGTPGRQPVRTRHLGEHPAHRSQLAGKRAGNSKTALAGPPDPDALMGRDAVFINDVAGAPGVPLALMFERVERLPDFEVVHGGQVVRRFAIYRCTGFKSLPVPD